MFIAGPSRPFLTVYYVHHAYLCVRTAAASSRVAAAGRQGCAPGGLLYIPRPPCRLAG